MGRGREVGQKHPAEKEEEKRRKKRRRGKRRRKRERKEKDRDCLLYFPITILGLDTHNVSGGGEEGRVIVTMTSVTLGIVSPREQQDMSSPQQALAHLPGRASASSPQHHSPIWSILAYQHLRSAASPTGIAKMRPWLACPPLFLVFLFARIKSLLDISSEAYLPADLGVFEYALRAPSPSDAAVTL